MTEYLSEWEGKPRIIYLMDYEKTKQEHMELYTEILKEDYVDYIEEYTAGDWFKNYVNMLESNCNDSSLKENGLDAKSQIQLSCYNEIYNHDADFGFGDEQDRIDDTLRFGTNIIGHFLDVESFTRFQNQLYKRLYDMTQYDLAWVKEHPEYIDLPEPMKSSWEELFWEMDRRMNTRITRWTMEHSQISDGNFGFSPGWNKDSESPYSDPNPWTLSYFPTMEELEKNPCQV